MAAYYALIFLVLQIHSKNLFFLFNSEIEAFPKIAVTPPQWFTTINERKGQNKQQPEAKAELVRISQCCRASFGCAAALFPHTIDSKFQAKIKVIMVIKNSESIGSSQNCRKMASLGRNNLDDSHKCVYLFTTYFRCTQNASSCSYLPTFLISIFLLSKAGGSPHHTPFTESFQAMQTYITYLMHLMYIMLKVWTQKYLICIFLKNIYECVGSVMVL